MREQKTTILNDLISINLIPPPSIPLYQSYPTPSQCTTQCKYVGIEGGEYPLRNQLNC